MIHLFPEITRERSDFGQKWVKSYVGRGGGVICVYACICLFVCESVCVRASVCICACAYVCVYLSSKTRKIRTIVHMEIITFIPEIQTRRSDSAYVYLNLK